MNDQQYWHDFYCSNNKIQECSQFCNFVMKYLENENITNVLDCGCGNGRDSYALSQKYVVDGVDNCGFLPQKSDNTDFMTENFVTMDKNKYHLVYSRFTFHSITNDDHIIFLDSIQPNTYLAIETRSKKGETNDVYHGKTHYRNYTDVHYIRNLLQSKGFEILFIEEDINMANYKNENPICIRIISKKCNNNV